MGGPGSGPVAGATGVCVNAAGVMDPRPFEDVRRRILVAVRRTFPSRFAAQSGDAVQTVLVRIVLSPRAGERSPMPS